MSNKKELDLMRLKEIREIADDTRYDIMPSVRVAIHSLLEHIQVKEEQLSTAKKKADVFKKERDSAREYLQLTNQSADHWRHTAELLRRNQNKKKKVT